MTIVKYDGCWITCPNCGEQTAYDFEAFGNQGLTYNFLCDACEHEEEFEVHIDFTFYRMRQPDAAGRSARITKGQEIWNA